MADGGVVVVPGVVEGRVTLKVRDGVAMVMFNRADKRNALDNAMFTSIAAVGEHLKTARGVRAVVVAGEGQSFCAGLDFSSFQSMAGGSGAVNAGAMTDDRITHLAQQICWVWQEVPVPVVAALHGHALGGGLQIALGTDIRVAHPHTQLSVRELFWGLIPDMTGTLMLGRLVRPDVAKDLVFTARILAADEGHRLGLVTELADDPLGRAVAIAEEIASRSPDAVRAAKRLLNRLMVRDAAEQFAVEREEIYRLIGSANQAEAVMSYFEKRPPRFVDPD